MNGAFPLKGKRRIFIKLMYELFPLVLFGFQVL